MGAAFVAAALPAHAQTQTQAPAPEPPTIVTTGESVVRRAPDRAELIAAVETRARSPRDAQRQNADAMTAVQQRILAAGVAKEAVRTLGYNIQQEFDYVSGRRVSRGYVARNSVEVRVDALERLGELIDAIVEGGATSVSSIQFDLKDRAAAEREALRLAVVDAWARAEAAAAGVGRGIDRVLRIEDARSGPPLPRPMPMLAARDAAQADVSTPIEAGEIEIHAQATLTVTIR